MIAPSTTIFSPGGNLSAGGMLIKARSNISPGTEMAIRFQLPYLGDMVETRGVVRWRQMDIREEETVAVGVEFTELHQTVRERLNSYIETQSLGDR